MSKTIVIDTPEGIAFAQMCARKAALALECKGMKRRGQSAYSICKQEYGLKGTKQKVLEQMEKMVEDVLAKRDMMNARGRVAPEEFDTEDARDEAKQF